VILHGLLAYQAARDDAALGIFEISDAIASFAWDLERLRELHEELTKEMAREIQLLRALGAPRAPLLPEHGTAGHLLEGVRP
jgi:hypothetical protein